MDISLGGLVSNNDLSALYSQEPIKVARKHVFRLGFNISLYDYTIYMRAIYNCKSATVILYLVTYFSSFELCRILLVYVIRGGVCCYFKINLLLQVYTRNTIHYKTPRHFLLDKIICENLHYELVITMS